MTKTYLTHAQMMDVLEALLRENFPNENLDRVGSGVAIVGDNGLFRVRLNPRSNSVYHSSVSDRVVGIRLSSRRSRIGAYGRKDYGLSFGCNSEGGPANPAALIARIQLELDAIDELDRLDIEQDSVTEKLRAAQEVNLQVVAEYADITINKDTFYDSIYGEGFVVHAVRNTDLMTVSSPGLTAKQVTTLLHNANLVRGKAKR